MPFRSVEDRKEYMKRYMQLPHAKEANKKRSLNNYYKDKESWKERVKRRKKEIRQIVMKHYGGKCKCCGESKDEFLTIDHINGDGAEHKRKIGLKRCGNRFYQWIVKNNFPSDLRILCWNCNCSLGFRGYCPHGNIKKGEKATNKSLPLFEMPV